ncbi:MAG: S8 family serine peptidase [Clostridiaceae bacterium]|nr:S8 family serine peptidase [Clostridiaceae bacterium]
MKIERRLFRSLVALSLTFLLVIGNATCFADAERPDKNKAVSQNRPAYKEGELLIKFKDGTSSQRMSAFSSENGLKQKKFFDSINVGLYSVKGDKSVNKVIKALEDSDGIEYVQPNYLYYPTAVPDDEYYDELWGLNNVGQKIKGIEGIEDVDIDAPEAWDITQGEDDIVVAVIDTGIDINHPELSGRMWRNPIEIPNNGVDDDGNGYIDDIYGWDFCNNDNSVFDTYDDHGTHVAGTIAAEANTKGVIGVAPEVKIMALKFIGPDGYGTTADAIKARNYAKRMGADIINASWGGTPDESDVDEYGRKYDDLLEAAIEGSSGMLFVTAAGNSSYNMDGVGPKFYPACFTSENILTVAAVDNTGVLADFSNYGYHSVDVGAPGVNIYSTIPDVAEGVAAVSVSGSYNVFLATFGLENLESRGEREELLSKIMEEMDFTDTGISIMLVDDDGNDTEYYENVRANYSDALGDLEYAVAETVNVLSDADNGPDFAAMSSHDLVIWFTGETYGTYYETTITDDDQESLISYLEDGGKLILFGQDALFLIEDSDLVKNYFDIKVTAPDYGRNTDIEGVESTVFEEVYYEMSGSTAFIDHISPGDKAESKLIYSSIPMDYEYLSGTSMAAPHVTGTAALLLSKNPDLTTTELKNAITSSGIEVSSLSEKTSSGKRVNAFNALKAVAPGKPTNLRVSNKSGSNITLVWEGREIGDFNKYIVERSIDGGAYSIIGNPQGNSYTDSGIDTSKTYRYRVAAVAAGEGYSKTSAYSSEVIGNTGTSVNPSPSTGKKGGGGGGGGAPTDPNPSIDSKIATALKNTKTGANIGIPMVRINGTDSASMSAKTIEDLSKAGKSLTLTGSGADITIPASALMTEEVKKLINDSTAKLSINVRETTGEEAKKLAGNAGSGIFMVGDRVFEFTAELKTSTETVNITKFVQELKISIKLSAAELKGMDTNKLGVYFYNSDKKAWEYVGGVFDSQTNTMTFGTGHFSQYAVMRSDGTYTDIGKHWAKPEIELMAAKHIIEAAAGGEFGPDVNITRAEIIKMLVNLLRYDPDRNVDLITPATATFKDVSVGSPYFSYVETAVKYGITTGNAGGTFGPDDTVTREQFATMIIRAMGIVTDSDSSILPFDDKGDIPEWAEKSVIAAYERGLMTGIGGNKFGVGSTATRAQAAVTIKRVMERSGLILVPEKLTGKLVVNDIEGQHYELETADDIYVIIHDADNKYLEKLLSRSVGKDIEASGYEQSGYNIYQRGKLFKAISIQVK